MNKNRFFIYFGIWGYSKVGRLVINGASFLWIDNDFQSANIMKRSVSWPSSPIPASPRSRRWFRGCGTWRKLALRRSTSDVEKVARLQYHTWASRASECGAIPDEVTEAAFAAGIKAAVAEARPQRRKGDGDPFANS